MHDFCVHSWYIHMTEASARRKKKSWSARRVRTCTRTFLCHVHVQKMYLITFCSKRRNTKMYNHIHCSECSLCRVHAATKSNKSSGQDGAFIHTFDSLSPKIYTGMRIANADKMYVYCTVQNRYAWFRAGSRGNRIAGVRLRGGRLYTDCWVQCGVNSMAALNYVSLFRTISICDWTLVLSRYIWLAIGDAWKTWVFHNHIHVPVYAYHQINTFCNALLWLLPKLTSLSLTVNFLFRFTTSSSILSIGAFL